MKKTFKNFTIKKSPIQGKGVFAVRTIKKGELVCIMRGKRFSMKELEEIYIEGNKRMGAAPADEQGTVADAGRSCDVTFEDIGNGEVRVTELFDPEDINSEEMQKNGWQSILNNFKKFVEGN